MSFNEKLDIPIMSAILLENKIGLYCKAATYIHPRQYVMNNAKIYLKCRFSKISLR